MSEFDGQILAWNNRKRLRPGYHVLFITKQGCYAPGELLIAEHDESRSQFVIRDEVNKTLHLLTITRSSPSTLLQFKDD